MLISRHWLNEFVDIPGHITAEELARLLTVHTVEVDGFENQADELKGVVVGEMLEFEDVPGTHLHKSKVDIGAGKPLNIVFGSIAQMQVGAKIAVAVAPTVLPGGKKIEKTILRGMQSEGMLCLEQELGLKKEGADVHFFDKKVKNGTPVVQARNLTDVFYDIDNKSLTHRPDLWGVYGLAREVAALCMTSLKPYPYTKITAAGRSKNAIKVKIKEGCTRYCGVTIENIVVGPSPLWLVERLEALGIRSINNVVDLTNYILLETGQPLHAFDADKIAGNELHVRSAEEGENVETLDGEKRKLTSSMLVIADKEKVSAIAGIMGGAASQVTQTTTRIFLEAATFHPIPVRKASSLLGLRTEASIRFEKGLDSFLPDVASARFVSLLKKLIPGIKVVGPLVDIVAHRPKEISFDVEWEFVHKRIGVTLEHKTIVDILERLGFRVRAKKSAFTVTVPTWRATGDITMPEDIVEEIARIHGYDALSPQLPTFPLTPPERNTLHDLENACKDWWTTRLGWTEVYNYSFVNKRHIELVEEDEKHYVRLKNPLSLEYTHLRRNFLPYLLINAEQNMHERDSVELFETGLVTLKEHGGARLESKSDELLPAQPRWAGGVYTAKGDANPVKKALALLRSTLETLHVHPTFSPTHVPHWAHPGRAGIVMVGEKQVGTFGEVHPRIAKNVGLKNRAAYWELHLENLLESGATVTSHAYQPLPLYPAVKRDISFAVDNSVACASIEQLIKNFNPALRRAEIFDIFPTNDGKKNVAFHLEFADPHRTMTAEEITGIFDDLAAALTKKFDAHLHA